MLHHLPDGPGSWRAALLFFLLPAHGLLPHFQCLLSAEQGPAEKREPVRLMEQELAAPAVSLEQDPASDRDSDQTIHGSEGKQACKGQEQFPRRPVLPRLWASMPGLRASWVHLMNWDTPRSRDVPLPAAVLPSGLSSAVPFLRHAPGCACVRQAHSRRRLLRSAGQ